MDLMFRVPFLYFRVLTECDCFVCAILATERIRSSRVVELHSASSTSLRGDTQRLLRSFRRRGRRTDETWLIVMCWRHSLSPVTSSGRRLGDSAVTESFAMTTGDLT